MKRITVFLLFVASTLLVFSCQNSGTNPKTIFTTIGLNSNKIPSNFRRAFDEIRGQKNIGNLKAYSKTEGGFITATAEEYVELNYKGTFDKDIEKIKALKGDAETQPIIDAGLVMFQYADQIYKSEYPKIAKMIDNDIPNEEINAAISDLEATKGEELRKLREETMNLLLPYADKKGVEYKTIDW